MTHLCPHLPHPCPHRWHCHHAQGQRGRFVVLRIKDAPFLPTWGAGTVLGGSSGETRAWAVPPVHRNPAWIDTRSPQFTWSISEPRELSWGHSQGTPLPPPPDPAPGLLLGGTRAPCPPFFDWCTLHGGQKGKTRGKKKTHCKKKKSELEPGWKMKPEENVKRSVFNPQPNMLAVGGTPRSHRQSQERWGAGFAQGYAAVW